jgi:hypothetical protein
MLAITLAFLEDTDGEGGLAKAALPVSAAATYVYEDLIGTAKDSAAVQQLRDDYLELHAITTEMAKALAAELIRHTEHCGAPKEYLIEGFRRSIAHVTMEHYSSD